ncbi:MULTISPECIES: mechanosensitive ion channel protein MscS [Cupriavidus]|uniref:Mechanosensitive ion channel protein MscS n=1 Tax=Cupriavidus pauculus TaxID=82633 RepID=A0A3G8H6F0_9BURK|nr:MULTISPECIES: mechanosensitive ion channel protein MscS [Cupriavidus]AZG15996.1 mechanosensitive ion channel protein MscS [Cupriavidus pauculus]MDT6964099.1 mechanosensitive ion channel protein MscS [Cupriavidus sp. SZY C1]
MRKSIRYTGIAVLSAAMLVAGTASARDRYHHGGGGSSAGAAIAVAAVAGLALGALVASSQPVVAAPAPYYAPPPQPVAYAAPAVPPGYCYDNYRGGYVPCGRPAPVQYAPPSSYYGSSYYGY